jgi:hypothetical protein
MEEEVQEILPAATLDKGPVPEPLRTRIARRFAELGLIAPLPELHGQAAIPAQFDA